jgi:hypothetical protein
MVHVQAIAELVNTSRDLLLVSREKRSVSRHARTLSNWTRSLRLKERTRKLATLDRENDPQARTHLHKDVEVSRYKINDGARRTYLACIQRKPWKRHVNAVRYIMQQDGKGERKWAVGVEGKRDSDSEMREARRKSFKLVGRVTKRRTCCFRMFTTVQRRYCLNLSYCSLEY